MDVARREPQRRRASTNVVRVRTSGIRWRVVCTGRITTTTTRTRHETYKQGRRATLVRASTTERGFTYVLLPRVASVVRILRFIRMRLSLWDFRRARARARDGI